jgi:hypothetical protein
MRVVTLAAALVAVGSSPSLSAAQSFCDQLNTIVAAAPQFVSLRGEAVGMQFHGSLSLEGTTQCEIRNKSDLDENWQPINEKWAYECLWENRTTRALPALKLLVGQCLPDARYSEGTPLSEKFANFTGGVFRIGEISIVTDYNKDTIQLWLTVLPAGVEQ